MSNRKKLSAGTSATLDINGQERVRPERARRGRVEKVWRCVRWAEAYPDESLTMNVVDLTPTFALRKLAVLFDGGKIAECAALVRRLSAITLESILGQLPVDILHDSLPSSLPVLEAIYVKVAQNSPGQLPSDKLRTDQLVQRLVALFAKHPLQRHHAGHALSSSPSPPRRHHPAHPLSSNSEEKNCNLHVPCCRSILRVIMDAEPNFRRMVAQRKRTLDKCLRRMGKHGLVSGGSDSRPLVSLHEALRAEFERQVALYRGALHKLEQLGLVSTKHGSHGTEKSVTARPAPTEASHQRLMQVSRLDVQERVIKNKTLLNSMEPTVRNLALQRLLRTLRTRVESDKLLLFHHTELRKMAAAATPSSFSSSSSCSLSRLAVVAESSSPSSGESNGLSSETQQMAATLIKFSQGYSTILRLAREVAEAQGDDTATDILDDDRALLAADDSSEDDDDDDEGEQEGKRGLRGEEGVEDILSVTSTLSILKKMRVVNLSGILPMQAATVTAGSASPGRGRVRNGWLDQNVQQQTTFQRSRGQRQRGAGTQTTPTMEDGESGGTSRTVAAHPHRHSPEQTAPQDESHLTSLRSSPGTPQDSHRAPQGSSPGTGASVAMLEQEVLYLRQELASAREQIRTLQDHEKQLRDRLVGQVQQQFQMGNEQFEDLSLGGQRPAELIRRYGELYLDGRVEALDALDRLAPLHGLDVLKLKILFSVVVLSFKATQQHVGELRGRLRHLLGLPVPPATPATTTAQDSPSFPQPAPLPHHHHHQGTNGNHGSGGGGGGGVGQCAVSPNEGQSAAAQEMEYHITAYLCKTSDSFEVAEIVFEVCQQIYATLYDYPCLKACPGLLHYVSHCVRLAWGLSVQRRPYTISYDSQTFQEGFHARFHTSDPAGAEVLSYLWPALVDWQGACVSRAVVIT